MSELEPKQKKPEEEHKIASPAHYQCPTCEQRVTSKYSNTLFAKYAKQPWMDHVRVMCPEDGFTGIYWNGDYTDDWANQFMSHEQDFCDEEGILEVRRSSLGIEDIQTKELSARQDRIIQRWGEFLQAVIVDASDFSNE